MREFQCLVFLRADPSTVYRYIDCFNGGNFLTEAQCVDMLLSPLANVRSFGNALFVRASPTQVLLIVIVTTVTVVIFNVRHC